MKKLLKLQWQQQTRKTWLFNLNEDPTEQVDLSLDEAHSAQLGTLRATLEDLDPQMAEPLWPTLVEVPIAVDYTIDKTAGLGLRDHTLVELGVARAQVQERADYPTDVSPEPPGSPGGPACSRAWTSPQAAAMSSGMVI